MTTTKNKEVPRIIYQFWTGDNPITERRLAGIASLEKNAGVKTVLLNKREINENLIPGVHLHPAYPFLNEVKQSDYLRCYFLHFFGGGYADIKMYSADNNWRECFDYINTHENVDVVGQREKQGGSPIREWNNPECLRKLISNGYFIVRPQSRFSSVWWERVNKKLDSKYEALKARPARCPRDRSPDFPLRWAELMGEIFHGICMEQYDSGNISSLLVSGRQWSEYQ